MMFNQELHNRLCTALGVIDPICLSDCDTRDLFEIYDGLLTLFGGERKQVQDWLNEKPANEFFNGRTPLMFLKEGQSKTIRSYVEILCGRC